MWNSIDWRISTVGHFEAGDRLSDVYRRLAEHAVEDRLPTSKRV